MAPVLGVDVVEEDEGVAVMLVLLARPEKLHILLSTATRFCCSTPKRQNSERERWGTERGNGGGGEGKGRRGARARSGVARLLLWRGKEGRGAELAVAEGAPLLCTFGVRYRKTTSRGGRGQAGRGAGLACGS